MTKQISSRNWETLSAYLDGQLTPGQHARLEARLESEPDLKNALIELQRTRDVLRATPRMRAPRNFTLRPEIAKQPKRIVVNLYPAFRFASALVSFLFVLIFVGDYLSVGSRDFAPTENIAPAPMDFVASDEDALALDAPMAAPTAVESLSETIPVEELAAEPSILEVQETEGEVGPLHEAVAEAEVAAEQMMEKQATDADETGMPPEQGAAKEVSEDQVVVSEPLEEPKADINESLAGETQRNIETDVPEVVEYPPPGINEDNGSKIAKGWSLIRILEIILGITALILVSFTLILRRQVY